MNEITRPHRISEICRLRRQRLGLRQSEFPNRYCRLERLRVHDPDSYPQHRCAARSLLDWIFGEDPEAVEVRSDLGFEGDQLYYALTERRTEQELWDEA